MHAFPAISRFATHAIGHQTFIDLATMRCLLLLQAGATAAALLAFLWRATEAFSFGPQPAKPSTCQLSMQSNDGQGNEEHIKGNSRREFLSKMTAATAPVLFGASQAAAVIDEPTRIELEVDTEYLIRVLNYFDGECR